MSATGVELTFVIPVRDDAGRLRLCLTAIADNTAARQGRVVVADNGSLDDSRLVAEAAGATVLTLPGRRVGELRNLAAATAASPLIGFVDADHVIDSGWITAALDIFDDPGIAAAGAPYSAAPAANWVQRAYDRVRPVLRSAQPADWLGSGNLIVRREAFERVGGFDTSLESCEDVDLCNRLRAAGYRLVADPRLRSVHLGDPGTLRALFFGELWRGRNNIKVSLRGPWSLRALPSVAIPIGNFAALIVAAAGVAIGHKAAAAALLTFAGLTALRAARMSVGRAGLTARDVAANIVVAIVFELGRALSIVTRATHRTRREIAGERAVA